MQNLIKIYHVVQEFMRIFLLTANDRTDGETHIVVTVQTKWSCNQRLEQHLAPDLLLFTYISTVSLLN